MASPTIADLTARMQAVKNAPMFSKAQAAELALTDFLQFLAAQDARLTALEKKGATNGN